MLRRGLLLGRKCFVGPNAVNLARRRTFASIITDISQLPKAGDKLHGFTVQRTKHIPELELTAVQLQHEKTGADYIHIAREDKNNVFSIGFKTNPTDDTGTPHILEHVTLCGSKKYPVRDPFFKMLNRSLSNFMNAFTSSDHTTYPFATTNPVDYYNLMDVYLDATLSPLLKDSDFKQEGWRIGPEDPKNKDSPLLFKGVVYNEMKGQMNDPNYHFYIRFMDHIFPSIHNSGGDPARIPDLTIERLREFHHQHYHPSNAKVFSYGDMAIEEHLKRVNEKLSLFEKIQVDRELKQPIQIDGPLDVKVPGPVSPNMEKERQFSTSLSWIMNDTSDVVESFGLGVLNALLIDGYGSPMYQGLIESKLGYSYSANTGYSASSSKAIFSLGLQNVLEEDIPKVGETIKSILQQSQKNGFEQRKVDGILHQLTLQLKHRTAKYGLEAMQGLMPSWFNGVDPFDSLAHEEVLSQFRERYNKGGYFEGLIEKYLLNNKHLTFTMYPVEDFSEKLAEEESKNLKARIEKADKEVLVKEEAELAEIQEAARKQDLSCLPTLRVSDITRSKEVKPVEFSSIGNTRVQWRLAPTNGLTYFRAINVFEDLPENLRMWLPLFTEAIFKLGTKTRSIADIEDEIMLRTGGISVSTHIAPNHSNLDKVEEGISWSGYCLDENVPHMYELMRQVLTETDFDQPTKLNVMVQGQASSLVNSLAGSGHSYARLFAQAHLSPGGRLSEVIGGLTQVRLLSELAATQDYGRAIDSFKKISQFVASKASLRTAITCTESSQKSNESALSTFLNHLPTTKTPVSSDPVLEFGPQTSKAFFTMPYQVSYAAMAKKAVPYTHTDGPALQILAQLLTHKHLHHEIREKGGAYGGGAYLQGLDGMFGFYSYRDPNVPNTLKVMQTTGKWAAENEWTERDLEEAKLAVFQGIDAPTSVSQEGMARFVHGITDEMRQVRREKLLDVQIKDVKDVANKYLANPAADDTVAVAVIGELKEWVSKDEWAILSMDVNHDPSQYELPEEASGKIEL